MLNYPTLCGSGNTISERQRDTSTNLKSAKSNAHIVNDTLNSSATALVEEQEILRVLQLADLQGLDLSCCLGLCTWLVRLE